MTSPQVAHGAGAPERHRRLLPAGRVALIYFVAGTLWVLGNGPAANAVAEVTSLPRWVVEVGKGVWFVAITALVLHVLMRNRMDRLEDAAARTHHDSHRLQDHQTRDRLQATALSGTANAIMITDRDGTIEWVNAAFETISGYPSSVAVGATNRLLHSGVQDEAFYEEVWETILAGQVWRGQVVNRHRNGELYTVSQTITPVVAENGEIQNFVGIHEDISDRVRFMGELEASHLRLQSLFDHALDAIILADDQGRYIEVNAAACELSGYSRDELVGMGPAELASPDQQPAEVATQFDEFVRAGTDTGTFALRHKDGHVVETEYRAVSNIQPGVHLSVLRDVTARNDMLRALTVAEEEFRGLAENAADIVAKLRVDVDGTLYVDYINPAAFTILGYPVERFYDDPNLLVALFSERMGDMEDSLAMLPTPDDPTKLATVQIQRSDGRLAWLEVHSTLTDPSTTPVTIQLLARDVTARFEMVQALEQAVADQLEAADQLSRLNVMKDTFLQSVSHELRTPLTSVIGFAQLLTDPRHGLSPQQTLDFNVRILTSAKRLQRLLDDLLDIDRFARGNLMAVRVPTDLTALVEAAVDEEDLGDHAVELDLDPITMDLDAPWVERVVANLVSNVARHTPPQTRICVRTRATADGAELTVDDDGPGIPEADRQRVIEPFQQGDHAGSSAQPGTGVGLSLVDAVAQMHGGSVHITDSPDGGTRVTVTLMHAVSQLPASPAGHPVNSNG